jgi:hypothetical protein
MHHTHPLLVGGALVLAVGIGSTVTAPVRRPGRWPPPGGFLADQLGMTEMVAGPFRPTGTRVGEVGFRHQYGEGRRLRPQTGPHPVVVRLQRLPAGWWVLGVNGHSIQITSPTRLQRISSPLTVHGSASTKPGELGTLRFRQPASTGPGWVTFYDASADGSNGIVEATMVRVQFATATRPRASSR